MARTIALAAIKIPRFSQIVSSLHLLLAASLATGCASAPAPVVKPPRPAWMPPEMACPQAAIDQLGRMGLKAGMVHPFP